MTGGLGPPSPSSSDWMLFDERDDHDNNNDYDDEEQFDLSFDYSQHASSLPVLTFNDARAQPLNGSGPNLVNYNSYNYNNRSSDQRYVLRNYHRSRDIHSLATLSLNPPPVPPHLTPIAMASSGASPSRLPSPPPFPEVQIGPQSPTVGDSSASQEQFFTTGTGADENATRRIRPGSKAADMASGPPLVPLSQVSNCSRCCSKLLIDMLTCDS